MPVVPSDAIPYIAYTFLAHTMGSANSNVTESEAPSGSQRLFLEDQIFKNFLQDWETKMTMSRYRTWGSIPERAKWRSVSWRAEGDREDEYPFRDKHMLHRFTWEPRGSVPTAPEGSDREDSISLVCTMSVVDPTIPWDETRQKTIFTISAIDAETGDPIPDTDFREEPIVLPVGFCSGAIFDGATLDGHRNRQIIGDELKGCVEELEKEDSPYTQQVRRGLGVLRGQRARRRQLEDEESSAREIARHPELRSSQQERVPEYIDDVFQGGEDAAGVDSEVDGYDSDSDRTLVEGQSPP